MNFVCVNNKTGALEGFCLIKTLERKLTAKGLPYLDLTLVDAGGEIDAKFWDFKEELHGEFAQNQLVKVRGTVSVYNGADQMRVERMRQATEKDEVQMEDFVPSAPLPSPEMLAEIRGAVAAFRDEELRRLVTALLDDCEDRLLYWPAAFRLHHAIRGGLLYHTLSVLRLAQAAAKLYPFADADLLFSGVILHDIEKLSEFEVPATGLAAGYTAYGNLVGHLAAGAMLLERKGRELGISSETLMLLEHMLLSHHGEPEFGCAVRPLFLEAELLSALDTLDAKVYEIQAALEGVQVGEFSSRHWALDNRKFYRHGRVPEESGGRQGLKEPGETGEEDGD
ncbi:MAG: HD domain-containing protein [Oscillospiraceae bacterium]|nr:HD domain-containing protein [Oscillospiraceae bacterium]